MCNLVLNIDPAFTCHVVDIKPGDTLAIKELDRLFTCHVIDITLCS